MMPMSCPRLLALLPLLGLVSLVLGPAPDSTDFALAYLVTEGMGKSLTTTTAKDDVDGFIYGQKGLTAGLGLQGSKITEIEP